MEGLEKVKKVGKRNMERRRDGRLDGEKVMR